VSIFRRSQGLPIGAGAGSGGGQSNISHVYSNGSNAPNVGVGLSGNASNGDLMVGGGCYTFDSSVVTIGTQMLQPAVGGLIEAVSLNGNPGVVSNGAFAYKYADEGSSELWTGWTNAGSMTCGIYRGCHPTIPILAMSWNCGNGNNVIYNPISHNNSKAWVVAFCRLHNDVQAAPTLLTPRTAAARRYQWDSDGAMSNYPGETIEATGSASHWITCVFAIASS